jgi:sigma-B regulation protein RsbU (phosphoserine phosphatase)
MQSSETLGERLMSADKQLEFAGKERRRNLELHMDLLAEVSQAFASSLDLDETLHNAVAKMMDYLKAEAASLFLLENDDRELVCKVCVGPVDITGLRLDSNKGIVGRTVWDGSVQMIRDAREEPDFAGFVDEQTGFTTRSILCAPLSVSGQRIGCLEVINKTEADGLFGERDRSLIEVLGASASLAIHNATMATALVEQERMRKELDLAREIQLSLLPRSKPDDYPVCGINASALEVSGDFYDCYTLADGQISFNLGDVSGKGMNAALLMAKTSSLLHCLGKSIPDPCELLAKVNEEICESATRGMFVTVVAGVYDPATGRLRWANAGHQPPLHRAADGAYQEFEAVDAPLGIVPGVAFTGFDLQLDGGSFFLFTDGVTEGYGAQGDALEVEGLKSLIERHRNLSVRTLLKEILKEMTSSAQGLRDDLTLLVVREGAGHG